MLNKIMLLVAKISIGVCMVSLFMNIFIDIPTYVYGLGVTGIMSFLLYDTVHDKLEKERKWKLHIVRKQRKMGSK